MGKGGFLICIGPVCIPIQALYGALPVLYLLWDRIRPFFAALFPSVFPPLEEEEVDVAEQAKLLAALKPEALEALRKGTGGGMEEVTEEEVKRWVSGLPEEAEDLGRRGAVGKEAPKSPPSPREKRLHRLTQTPYRS